MWLKNGSDRDVLRGLEPEGSIMGSFNHRMLSTGGAGYGCQSEPRCTQEVGEMNHYVKPAHSEAEITKDYG